MGCHAMKTETAPVINGFLQNHLLVLQARAVLTPRGLPWSSSVAVFVVRLQPSVCIAALGVLGALPVMDRL